MDPPTGGSAASKRSGVQPGDETSCTSSDLLRRARRNDEEAWRRLVEFYSRRMYRWCRVAGLQPADAQNVVQDAFSAVVKSLPEFRHERGAGTFRGWLRRITDNKIRDHFRRHGREGEPAAGGTEARLRFAALPARRERGSDPVEGEEATWDTTLAARQGGPSPDVAAAIEKVRGEVSPRDWRLFWRVVVDGQPAVEVAREFGLTANAVRLVKMKVLRRLHQEAGNKEA